MNSTNLGKMIEHGGLYTTQQPGDFGTTDFGTMLHPAGTSAASDSRGVQQTTLNRAGEPFLTITEQPKARGLRFRYKCEGRSAGAILGDFSVNDNRTFPTIQIHNFAGPSAIIVVSCVTKDDPPRPHPHSLVGKDCKEGVCTVKLKGSTQLSFPNLGIQCTTKKDVNAALKNREKIRVDPFGVGYHLNTNNIDLNVVRLAFQCFLPDKHGKYTRIVPPVVSQCIYDKKAINDLVICRLSSQAGRARGGDEVFMLTEKVNKDDIQIRFYEDTPDGVKWSAYADFGQQDVHRQYAVVFRTPPYHNPDITAPVQVYIQLERTSDRETSEPKPFQYTPDDPDPDGIEKKRKRKQLDYHNLLQDIGMEFGGQPGGYGEEEPASQQHTGHMEGRDNLKQRIKLKAQRNLKDKGDAVAASSSATYVPAPYEVTTDQYTTGLGQVLQQVSSDGAATYTTLTTAAAPGNAPMDMFRAITGDMSGRDLLAVAADVNMAGVVTETGSLNVPSLSQFDMTQLPSFKAAVSSDLMQQHGAGDGGDGDEAEMAAEEVVASEEVVVGDDADAAGIQNTLSIGTQQKLTETFQALSELQQ